MGICKFKKLMAGFVWRPRGGAEITINLSEIERKLGLVKELNYSSEKIMTTNKFVFMTCVGLTIFWLYNFICDLAFSGTTIGKYIVKIRLCRNNVRHKSFKFALSHSLLKQMFLMTSWIGLLIYILSGYRTPYDRFLNITLEQVEGEV